MSLLNKQWEEIQTRTFTRWVNAQLAKKSQKIESLTEDFESGVNLCLLFEVISDEKFPHKIYMNPKLKIHKIANLNNVVTLINSFVDSVGIKVQFSAEQIFEGDKRTILGLIWCLIHKFEIQDITEEELSARDGLLLWAQKKTKGYEGVDVKDFSNSWKNGLAFNALIHRHHPELLNFNDLDANDTKKNLEQAFEIAEKELDIPQLLDVNDMIDYKPDPKSVMTYVAYMWKKFSASNKFEKAAKKIGAINKKSADNQILINDYEERAKNLIEWIKNKTNDVKDTSPEVFGFDLPSCQARNTEFKSFRKDDTPEKNKEKKELELLLSNLRTKQKNEGLQIYAPPEELSSETINSHWDVLSSTQKEYEKALNERIQLMKKLELILNRFRSSSKQILDWQQSKLQTNLALDLSTLKTIPQVKAAINALETLSGEMEGISNRLNNELSGTKTTLVENKHLSLEEVEATFGNCEQGFTELTEKKQQLEDDLKKLQELYQEIETLCLEFAKQATQLNLIINEALTSLIEPVFAQTPEEVEEAQKRNEKVIENLKNAKEIIDSITELHNKITEKERDSGTYSSISYPDITEKYENAISDLEKRKSELESEMEKQLKNVELLKQWEEKCAEFINFVNEKQEKLNVDDENVSYAQQLEDLKKKGEETIEKSSEMINGLSELYKQCEEVDIANRVQTSMQTVNVNHSKLKNLVDRRTEEISNKIKQLEFEIKKFNSRVQDIQNWQMGKKSYLEAIFEKEMSISQLETEIVNTELTLPNELKNVSENFSTTEELAKKIMNTHHEESEHINLTIEEIVKNNEQISTKIGETTEKLKKLLESKQSVEKNCLDFAKIAQDVNLFLDNALLQFSEPVSASSVKEVEESITNFEKLENSFQNERKEQIDQIGSIHKEVTGIGMNPEIYSPISMEVVSNKFEEVGKLMEERKAELEKEKEVQGKNAAILAQYNQGAEEYQQFNEKSTGELTSEAEGELEEQLAKIKELGQNILSESEQKIESLKEQYKEMEVADIEEFAILSLQEIETIKEQLEKTFSERTSAIEKSILAKQATGISEEQLNDFHETFNYFDKDKDNKLTKLEFKAAISSLGEDFEDEELDKVFKEYDKDDNGTISFNEFIAFMTSISKAGESHSDFVQAFKEISGHDSIITETQLRRALEPAEVEELIKLMPQEGDGYNFITYADSLFAQ